MLNNIYWWEESFYFQIIFTHKKRNSQNLPEPKWYLFQNNFLQIKATFMATTMLVQVLEIAKKT